jgi:hypothetical protein
MAAGNRNPGSALQRATGADLELQAGAAFQLGHYPNHRETQARRLARLYGLPGQRARLLAYLVYGEEPK